MIPFFPNFSGILSSQPLGAAIFEGDVDFDLGLSTSVAARLGKPFFNKCFTKFNQDIPLTLKAHGSAYVSVRAMAKNVRIERRPFSKATAQARTLDLNLIKNLDKLSPPDGIDDGLEPYLVFKIDLKFDTKLKHLHVDYIHVGKCDVRLGGLRLFSYCGLIKKAVNNAVNQIASDMNEMHAPDLLKQIEAILKYKMGDEIAIPLLVAEEKDALIKSLTAKAGEVASLKASLVNDLSGIVAALNG